MSSVVFYRFKSQKDPSTIQFEGTGISVWDLKKDILAENKLGKGADFDFAIYNADTNEEYSDDKAIVPRSTSVIARRLPPSRPGRGNAQYYMVSSDVPTTTSSYASSSSAAHGSGARRNHMSRRFDGKEDSPQKVSKPAPQTIVAPAGSTDADEASKIAAMFANTSEQWNKTQEKMSSATAVHYGNRRPGAGQGGPGGRPSSASMAPDKPVPSGYVCYRCGQPGHWIQDCPTNDKPEWDNKPRIKRTTGIPKSFLQTVEGPGKDGEVNQPGMMIGADGTFVIARPDAASWEKHRAVQANLTSTDIQNLPPTDPDLTCPLCNRLLREAVKTPCCGTSYCEECIQNYLSENDFVCPECESKIKSLKNLVKDEDRRTRAKQYMEDTLKASKAAAAAEKEKDKDQDKASTDGDKEKDKDRDAASKSEAGSAAGRRTDRGPTEEGELEGDEQATTSKRNLTPGAAAGRAGSVARSDRSGSISAPNGHSNSGNQGGMMSMINNNNMNPQMMMNNQMSMMNNMFNHFQNNNHGGGGMHPQVQMIQAQIQQIMQMLQNPQLPPPMRMQLMAQLQGLQYQWGQMMQMMQAQGGYGNNMMPMQQQMMMMQQMQQASMMMMQQQQQQQQQSANMYNAGGNGYGHLGLGPQQPYNASRYNAAMSGRHGAQYEEDSADSPYMRVPINPKFRKDQSMGVKRERPEDFVELGHQPIKRL